MIAPIVEGHGEVRAVPVLLRRLLQDRQRGVPVDVLPPIRVHAQRFLKGGDDANRHLELADRSLQQHRSGAGCRRPMLVLIDVDDGCVGCMATELRAIVSKSGIRSPTLVALACREYETWFLTAAQSLEAAGCLPRGTVPPPDPMALRDAKGWLDRARERYGGYDPVLHQTELTNRFSLEEAAANSSFARLVRKLQEPVPALD